MKILGQNLMKAKKKKNTCQEIIKSWSQEEDDGLSSKTDPQRCKVGERKKTLVYKQQNAKEDIYVFFQSRGQRMTRKEMEKLFTKESS